MGREEGNEGQERRWFRRKSPELNLPPTFATISTFTEQVASLSEQYNISRIWTEKFITPEHGEVNMHMMKLADKPNRGEQGQININLTNLSGEKVGYHFNITEDTNTLSEETVSWDWEMMLVSLRELGLISEDITERDEVVDSLKIRLLGEGQCAIVGKVGTITFEHVLPMGNLPEVFMMTQETPADDPTASDLTCYQVRISNGEPEVTSWKEQKIDFVKRQERGDFPAGREERSSRVNADWYAREQKRVQDDVAGLRKGTEATLRQAVALMNPLVTKSKKER